MRARTEDAHHEMRTARAELSAVKASLRDFEASSAAEAASAAAAAEGGSGVSRKATPEAGDPPLDPMEC